jgi:hypothetical protein
MVKDKILRFAQAALAAAWMRGKSYLSIGAVSMGIAGSIMDPDFFQDYLNYPYLQKAERDNRTGLRHHQVRAGLPAVSFAWACKHQHRMGSGDTGL